MIYGANGYSGRLIAQEAVRLGARPVLAGRNREVIERLAAELGCESRVFALDALDPVRDLEGMRLVMHAAGPFSATSRPMIDACLAVRAHYLDITGEIDVIEHAAACDSQARAVGVMLLPAVGFDVVPSDCLARTLADALPSATQLTLAFAGDGQISPGTAKTMIEMMPRGGRVRRDGKIVAVPANWKMREIPFRSGPQQAMTIPWGDVASAFHSTAIPNIEVYLAAPRAQRGLQRGLSLATPLMRFGFVQRQIQQFIERKIKGPDDASRTRSRASFWGEVSDEQGHRVTGTLETPGGYQLTMLSAVECVRRTLAGKGSPGFRTPTLAFGWQLILSLPNCDLRISDRR
jgi:short subunit dehydrogenase-like uncharacterized protein